MIILAPWGWRWHMPVGPYYWGLGWIVIVALEVWILLVVCGILHGP